MKWHDTLNSKTEEEKQRINYSKHKITGGGISNLEKEIISQLESTFNIKIDKQAMVANLKDFYS